MLLDIRYRFEYAAVLLLLGIIKLLPKSSHRSLAAVLGRMIYLVPSARKTVLSNIHCAMPELEQKEVRRIAKSSFTNMMWNLIEFFWASGNPRRIVRCYHMPDSVKEALARHTAAGERVIFVNPHLGSWEASGVMAPFYAGVDMAAIAKPVRNPYLNRMLNSGNREKIAKLEIIFSKGAVRAAVHALRAGKSLGTLIDQNTRVRDGGEFVNFFGLPVPSSTAPAALKRYCDQHDIKCVIMFGTTLRLADGKNTAFTEYLSKDFSEYADDKEILQELMNTTERYIRQYPEQYLWFYKRFQYIPSDVSPDLRSRYPFYSKEPDAKFYRKVSGTSKQEFK